MLPWGHLSVAYICYVGWLKLRDDVEGTRLTLLAVAVGSQFPDLVDKPLAWTVAVLPSGRSLAHSLITAAVVLTVGYWIGCRIEREAEVTAFGIGYVSHSVADLSPWVLIGLAQGNLAQLQEITYLLWPFLRAKPYLLDPSFLKVALSLRPTPYLLSQIALAGVVLWFAFGAPGIRGVRGGR